MSCGRPCPARVCARAAPVPYGLSWKWGVKSGDRAAGTPSVREAPHADIEDETDGQQG
jgi:hypothetical protein